MKNRLALFFILLALIMSALKSRQNISLATPLPSPSPSPSPPPPSKQPPVLTKSDATNSDQQPPGSTSTQRGDLEEIGDDGIIRVNTTLVTVPASVMDRNGRYIFDLERSEFRLFEDGIEQEIAFFASTEKPFTVVLMLDVSDSAVFRIDEVKNAAVAFVDQLRPDDRAIIVAFARRVEVLADSTTDKEVLRKAIRGVTISTGTSLYNAVDMTLKQVLLNVPGRKAIVLFTDGVDTASLGATFESNLRDSAESDPLIYTVQYDLSPSENRKLTNSGVQAVGVGERTQRVIANKYLSLLPAKTGGRQFFAKTIEELKTSFANIAEELRHQYSLGFYPQRLKQQGQQRRIRVRVTRPKVIVRSRVTYGAD